MRDLVETIRMALAALARRPLRTGLTILGLAIGVGAYIAMTSFGQGAKRAVISQFAALGVNLVRVQTLVHDPAAGPKPARPLVESDVEALRRELTSAGRVVPNSHLRLPAAGRGNRYFVSVIGTTPEYFTLRDWHATVGGVFDANDQAQRGKVCVLGATPRAALFGADDPVGATISLGDALACTVIGVLAPKGLNTSGRDLDDLIVIPSTTFAAYVGLDLGYDEIEVEAISPQLIASVRDETTTVMRRAHAIAFSDPNDFRITSPSEAIKAATNVSTILTRLLAAIAAVSLLVGGIGIMNIQLVSVAERTREIGIRTAIGAAPRQILVQFLVEAIVLSSTGALVGVIAGLGGAWAVGRAMHWSQAVDVTGVLTAAAFGVGAGVVFGYAPARRAARLEPIDALRHE